MTQEEPQVGGGQPVAAAGESMAGEVVVGSAGGPGSDPACAENEVVTVRELILRAYPDVVPELVRGGTIGELSASIEPARSAYRQVAERIAAAGRPAATSGAATDATPAPTTPPAVPAGAVTVPVIFDGLPASELIKRGLAGARRRG